MSGVGQEDSLKVNLIPLDFKIRLQTISAVRSSNLKKCFKRRNNSVSVTKIKVKKEANFSNGEIKRRKGKKTM